MKKTTMSDIAKELNVSVSTVSRALNNHEAVRSPVRKKIIQAALRLNYVAKSKKSREIIALVLPSSYVKKFGTYYSRLLSLLSMETHNRSYAMELVMADCIDTLHNTPIKGAISLAPNPIFEEQWGEKFALPLVCINSSGDQSNKTYSVSSDEVHGISIAMNYLLEQGHKNIAFITYGIISNYNNIHRRDAFIQFSKNNALNGNTHYVHINSNDNFIEIIAKVLKKNVTAIISSGEDVGIYTAYVLDLLGKKIPDDLSFISYEYIDVSCYFSPPHTTLEQDFQSLSKLSMDLCENLSDGNMSNVGNKIVPYKFNIRDSVSRVGIPKIQTR